MKKSLLLLILFYALTVKSQYYSFSKSFGTYTDLYGATVIVNDDWFRIDAAIKVPFSFKYWGVDIIDSIYLDALASISVNNKRQHEIAPLVAVLSSRGVNKSPVSYLIEGTTPNRVFKIQFKNTGFLFDSPGLTDSANFQFWLYEASNIIEFRYGPNKVKPGSWSLGSGAAVFMSDSTHSKFLGLKSDPSNPFIVTKDTTINSTLNGMPSNGFVYRFTPSSFPTGIGNNNIRIDFDGGKVSLPSNVEITSFSIYNIVLTP